MKLTRWLLVSGLLLLGACTTQINAPDDPVMPKHTPFEERLNIRYSPADWPKPLHADLYLAQQPVPGPAKVTSFLFQGTVMDEALAFLYRHAVSPAGETEPVKLPE